MTWGIWLVPIIPVVLYEAKISQSKLMPTLASVFTWIISVVSYYVFMAVKLIFIGQATMQELYIANYKDPFYWSNLKCVFLGDVLGGIFEWIGVAVFGGGIIGFLVAFSYLRLRKTRNI